MVPYIKKTVKRIRSKYEPISDKLQYLSEYKKNKYSKLLANIIIHLSMLSRIIEN